MIDALHISESGLKATQEWIDHISNNVANMQTLGYKKSIVHFESMVASSSDNSLNGAAREKANINNDSGAGTRLTAPSIDFSEGSLKATYRPLDVAIRGTGFLEVMQENGENAYTRIGNLRTNNDGMLTNLDGLLLSDQIQIPPDITQIEISASGKIEAKYADSSNTIELGQLHLAHISNPSALKALGGGLYTLTEESGEATIREAGTDGMGEITQGYLEMSNVELVDEMTNLVLAQRAYQLNARIIQTADQVLETINNLRR